MSYPDLSLLPRWYSSCFPWQVPQWKAHKAACRPLLAWWIPQSSNAAVNSQGLDNLQLLQLLCFLTWSALPHMHKEIPHLHSQPLRLHNWELHPHLLHLLLLHLHQITPIKLLYSSGLSLHRLLWFPNLILTAPCRISRPWLNTTICINTWHRRHASTSRYTHLVCFSPWFVHHKVQTPCPFQHVACTPHTLFKVRTPWQFQHVVHTPHTHCKAQPPCQFQLYILRPHAHPLSYEYFSSNKLAARSFSGSTHAHQSRPDTFRIPHTFSQKLKHSHSLNHNDSPNSLFSSSSHPISEHLHGNAILSSPFPRTFPATRTLTSVYKPTATSSPIVTTSTWTHGSPKKTTWKRHFLPVTSKTNIFPTFYTSILKIFHQYHFIIKHTTSTCKSFRSKRCCIHFPTFRINFVYSTRSSSNNWRQTSAS